MITLTQFAEEYPIIKINQFDINAIIRCERRPYWTEGFWRVMAKVEMKNGKDFIVTETVEEVEAKIRDASPFDLTELQRAILLLCGDLNISITSQSSQNAEINFAGKIYVDYNSIKELIDRKLITLGYKTGKCKLIHKSYLT